MLRGKRKTFGFKSGSPRSTSAIHSKYLLTGFVQCGVCSGTIVQTWSATKPAYRCWYNHSRGRAVCSNTLVVNMHLADDAVLRAVTRDVLDPAVVNEALDRAVRELEQPNTATAEQLDTLKGEFTRIETELARYVDAIADAGPLDTILQALKIREQRRDAIRAELKTLAVKRRAEPCDASGIRATLLGYLEDWRAMARQGVAEARGLLRAARVHRLVFTRVLPPPELPPRKGPGRRPRFVLRVQRRGIAL